MASARKLEQELNTMTETFYGLVRAAHVAEEKDESIKQDKKVPGEMMEVLAERLVMAGQSVLTLIAELKRQALLSDFTALNKMVDDKDAQYEAWIAVSEQRLKAAKSTAEEAQDESESSAMQNEGVELKRLYQLAQDVPLNDSV